MSLGGPANVDTVSIAGIDVKECRLGVEPASIEKHGHHDARREVLSLSKYIRQLVHPRKRRNGKIRSVAVRPARKNLRHNGESAIRSRLINIVRRLHLNLFCARCNELVFARHSAVNKPCPVIPRSHGLLESLTSVTGNGLDAPLYRRNPRLIFGNPCDLVNSRIERHVQHDARRPRGGWCSVGAGDGWEAYLEVDTGVLQKGWCGQRALSSHEQGLQACRRTCCTSSRVRLEPLVAARISTGEARGDAMGPVDIIARQQAVNQNVKTCTAAQPTRSYNPNCV